LRRARGFTLIEVLVALAIVAIGMAAVLGTLSSSAETISYLRDKTLAQWLALNKIAGLRLSGQQTPVGTSDGDSDFAGRSWHWRQEVVATEVPGVVRIDLKVRPAEVKAGDDNGWITTVSGIQGDAVGIPNGYQPDWGAQNSMGQGLPNAAGSVGANGSQGLGAPGTIGPLGPSGAPAAAGNGDSIGGPDTLLGGPDTLGGSQAPGSPQTPPTPPPQSDPNIPPGSSQ
jgi:type II secretion system protein I